MNQRCARTHETHTLPLLSVVSENQFLIIFAGHPVAIFILPFMWFYCVYCSAPAPRGFTVFMKRLRVGESCSARPELAVRGCV